MKKQTIRIGQIKVKPEEYEVEGMKSLTRRCAKILLIREQDIKTIQIIRKSIDARKKPDLFFIFTVDVVLQNGITLRKNFKNPNVATVVEEDYHFPDTGMETLKSRPVIIGAGPAGLFCAIYLAKNGYRPILLERGEDADSRKLTVETFWNHGILNPESNVQFGEGGAGTFSDGKLNTLVKDKYGRNKEVLRTLVAAGALEEILYEAKPHLGTDQLIEIVKTLRQEIINAGGEVRYQKKVSDLIIKNGKLTGLRLQDGEEIACEIAVLAIGHSARDTFEMLYQKKILMEPKSFAVGFRVEHRQSLINCAQYGNDYPECLPNAAYKVTAHTEGNRGVYSFCMCPGGYVVNASSEEKRMAVNGMSYSKRDGLNANSAIIVSVSQADFGSNHPLAGVVFQRGLEEKAYQAGNGMIPVQLYGDFKQHRVSTKESLEYEPAMKGAYCLTDLRDIFSESINQSFIEGMEQFGRMIPGFSDPAVILSGIESRTSSPIRMVRNEKTLSSNIEGIYPCGEGAGYAGGITSAAMDGIKVAEAIGMHYKRFAE